MTPLEARKVFEELEASAQTAEQRAELELLKEYFCNAEFREQFAAWAFEQTN